MSRKSLLSVKMHSCNRTGVRIPVLHIAGIFLFVSAVVGLLWLMMGVDGAASGRQDELSRPRNLTGRAAGQKILLQGKYLLIPDSSSTVDPLTRAPLSDAAMLAGAHKAELMTETFEGDWPGTTWTVLDYAAYWPSGFYIWGKRNCNPHNGNYAAWVVAGIYGGEDVCNSNYASRMSNVMRYGPMDWTNVISATVTFYLWGESIITDPQAPYEGDTLYVGSSTYCDELACIMAGEYFYGNYLNGSETNGYTRIEQGLNDGYGDDQVYLVFDFVSDMHDAARGFIVDDISLQAVYGKHIYVPLIRNNSN